MTNLTPSEIAAENARRINNAIDDYDPHRGIGCCGPRIEVDTPVHGLPRARVPREMLDDPKYTVASGQLQWRILRCRYDFEYWCVSCVRIKPKDGYRLEPFRLNRGQRKVLAVLEQDRIAGRPMRIIILKARQWGCSTLIQNYMAWIQMCVRPNWSSLICCQNRDSAVNIRRMYTNLIADYPIDLWDGGEDGQTKLQFRPFEGSPNIREIAGRGCRVAVSSSENQDAMRGYDIAMAHLSETAYWRDSDRHSPNDLIRSVCGSIALRPYTLIAMESTANGMGNYFYEEWQRAKSGLSDKKPVFIPWYEVEFNHAPLPMPAEKFAATLTDSESRLWQLGCTLEQIHWYREKSRADKDISKLHAEYPTDDIEAFGATNAGVFDQADIERLRRDCADPVRTCRVIDGMLLDRPGGELQIWEEPVHDAEYVVAVDIGGRCASSDWSVVAVMRRAETHLTRHSVVAQWRGHVDHDILVDIARRIAERYNEALLIIESNTLEAEANAGAGANSYILEHLAATYTNLYRRSSDSGHNRIGFHTNRSTKVSAINGLIKAVRDDEYIERSSDACYELAVYRQNENGAYGAKRGYHDDILMTRALALYAIYDTPTRRDLPPPAQINTPTW